MAYGDPLYQLNDVIARVKVLEQQSKASPAQALPNTPLTVATSGGQSVAGIGVTQDAVSRAVSTAVQSALTSAESLIDTLHLAISFNFGGGTTQTIRQTNYVRPDPIVGDVYRMKASGFLTNSTGSARAIEYRYRISGSPGVSLATFVIAPSSVFWLVDLVFNVFTAGPSSSVEYVARSTLSVNRAVVHAPQLVDANNDYLQADSEGAVNLIAPIPELYAICDIASASVTISCIFYALERVGSRSPDQV